MVNVTENSVAFGVDKVELLDPNANLGRKSIRLESLQTWTHGLFIVDLAHMPENTCAVWPAFWTVGKDSWPIGGEFAAMSFELPGNICPRPIADPLVRRDRHHRIRQHGRREPDLLAHRRRLLYRGNWTVRFPLDERVWREYLSLLWGSRS